MASILSRYQCVLSKLFWANNLVHNLQQQPGQPHKASQWRFNVNPLKTERLAWHPLQWRHNRRDGVSITSLTIVYSGADQRKHQCSASLAFVRWIHQWPVNSPHKGSVTRKMLPFDDVVMRKATIPWIMDDHVKRGAYDQALIQTQKSCDLTKDRVDNLNITVCSG